MGERERRYLWTVWDLRYEHRDETGVWWPVYRPGYESEDAARKAARHLNGSDQRPVRKIR